MHAIVFDFDTQMLKQQYPYRSRNSACRDVRDHPSSHGFEWKQGSAYFGDDSVDAVRRVRVVQRLAKKFNWFAPAVRDIHMSRVEENNDLEVALEDDED